MENFYSTNHFKFCSRGLGIDDDEKVFAMQNYNDMPKWKQNFVKHNREFYLKNREFIDDWVIRYDMTNRIKLYKKFWTFKKYSFISRSSISGNYSWSLRGCIDSSPSWAFVVNFSFAVHFCRTQITSETTRIDLGGLPFFSGTLCFPISILSSIEKNK